MRYHLESTLPIHAFQPLGGRNSPFKHGMTLEGGGGGNIISSVTDSISSVLGTDGGGGGILGGIEDVGQAVGGALADVDKAVGDTVPGGWGTVAAIAVPYLAPELIALQAGTAAVPLTAGQAAAVAAGTSAATGAIQGKDPDDILKDAALSGLTAYGLSSLGSAGESIDLPSETPYIDMPDGANLLTPDSIPLEEAIRLPTEVPYTDVPDIPSIEVPLETPYTDALELPKGYDPSTEILDTDYSVSQPQGIRSLVAEYGVDPTSLGGRADPFVGAYPTSNIYTDLPVGYEFMGPNGMEVVGPNGKTYLQKDLYEALSDRAITPAPTSPDLPSFSETVSFKPDSTPISLESPTGYTPTLEEEIKSDAFFNDLINKPSSTYTPQGVQIFDRSAPADAATQKMVETGYLDRLAELPGATYDMAKSYVTNYPLTTIGTVLGVAGLAGEGPLAGIGQKLGTAKLLGGSSPQSGGSQAPVPPKSSRYTGGYGISGGLEDPYLLRERINAANIYDYRGPSQYAKGGEVKHFAFGGISNAFTKAFQPIEKGIIQPIGQAVPFLRDVAPYAGLIAAPFITSPIAAAGIGGLASGFGRPGSGFDMKRALMGGIAAYGASTLGAGLEAAGTTPTAAAPVSDLVTAPPGTVGEGLVSQTSNLVKEAPKGFFRSPEAVGRGIGNLLSPSTYDEAAKNFGTQASIYKTGAPLIIGTTGMMAVDEAQKMQEQQDIAAAASRGEQQDMLARIAKGRRRAEEAVRANPYMYAVGGSVDDEFGYDSATGRSVGNMDKGLFGMGYAAGGQPRFLSGGGDGMSDSIPATIEGKQEARLADGEFVIPADVVSHLGNGSSKAGAKQLYSMMDRVRKARTGNEKQGRQISPAKMMPA